MSLFETIRFYHKLLYSVEVSFCPFFRKEKIWISLTDSDLLGEDSTTELVDLQVDEDEEFNDETEPFLEPIIEEQPTMEVKNVLSYFENVLYILW